MNKKIKITMVLSLIFLISLAPFAIAQESDEPIAKNSIGPGNIFYRLDVFFDEQRIKNSSPGIERARVAAEVAEERSEEIRTSKRADLIEIARANRQKAIKALEGEKERLTSEENQEIEERLSRNVEAISRVIARFKSDDNPNNDNAIPALEKARTSDKTTLREIRDQEPALVTAKSIDKVNQIDNQLKDAKMRERFQIGR